MQEVGTVLSDDEVTDVGLVDEQVGRDAAGVVPVIAPLEVAILVERNILVLGGFEEALPVGVFGTGVRRDDVAPCGGGAGRRVLRRIEVAVPEGAHVVALADKSVVDHFLGLDVELVGAVLGSDLDDCDRSFRRA